MRTLKFFGIYMAADFMCIFVASVFAAASGTAAKVLSLIFTVSLLLIMLGSFTFKEVSGDMRKERAENRRAQFSDTAGIIAGSSAVSVISWMILLISKTAGADLYRWHKLLNAGFLQLYNLINPDASSDSLSMAQIMIMLLPAIVPAVFTACLCMLIRKGFIKPEK